jgi:hypothetical protein
MNQTCFLISIPLEHAHPAPRKFSWVYREGGMPHTSSQLGPVIISFPIGSLSCPAYNVCPPSDGQHLRLR